MLIRQSTRSVDHDEILLGVVYLEPEHLLLCTDGELLYALDSNDLEFIDTTLLPGYDEKDGVIAFSEYFDDEHFLNYYYEAKLYPKKSAWLLTLVAKKYTEALEYYASLWFGSLTRAQEVYSSQHKSIGYEPDNTPALTLTALYGLKQASD